MCGLMDGKCGRCDCRCDGKRGNMIKFMSMSNHSVRHEQLHLLILSKILRYSLCNKQRWVCDMAVKTPYVNQSIRTGSQGLCGIAERFLKSYLFPAYLETRDVLEDFLSVLIA